MQKTTTSRAKLSGAKSHSTHTATRLLNITYVCVGLAILLIAVQFVLYGMRYRNLFDNTTYQAVTLTNGLTFFGQLHRYSPHTYALYDVYYLKADTDTAEIQNITDPSALDTETDIETDRATDTGMQLYKLSDDFYRPDNALIVNRDQILYWQNLQLDSPIIQTILNQE